MGGRTAISMKKPIYTIRSKVWLYPGMSGWHFANVNKSISKDIKKKFSIQGRGFGSVPVHVTLGSTRWKTSIFPDKKTETYVLPLKADVRKKEDIVHDSTISFTLEIIV